MQIAARPETSFVVIAFNEAQSIGDTLSSILDQCASGDEVIVVDDGSTDATPDIVAGLAARQPQLRLVRLARNRGRGYARARGVAEARGELLATIDGDIVLPPDWLERCRQALGDSDAAGGTAVPDGDAALVHSRVGLRPRVVPHRTSVTGSNGLYRRETLTRVSYDPELREGEDVALGHAMRAADMRLHTVDGLVVEHREGKSLGQTLTWMFQSGRGASRQLRRYRQLRGPDIAFLGWLLLWVVALRGGSRRRRMVVLPVAYTLAVAGAHVRAGFELEREPARKVAAAVALDALQLSAYFAGRVAGLPQQ